MGDRGAPYRVHRPITTAGEEGTTVPISYLGAICPPEVLGVVDPGFKIVDRDGRKRHDLDGAARAQVYRQKGGGGVVRGLDHGHEVIRTEDRELDDDLASDGLDLFVDCVESPRALVQRLASLRREGAQQDIHRHGRLLWERRTNRADRVVSSDGAPPGGSRGIGRPRDAAPAVTTVPSTAVTAVTRFEGGGRRVRNDSRLSRGGMKVRWSQLYTVSAQIPWPKPAQ